MPDRSVIFFNHYPENNTGGAETATRLWVSTLIAQGIKVSQYFLADNPKNRNSHKYQVAFGHFPHPQLPIPLIKEVKQTQPEKIIFGSPLSETQLYAMIGLCLAGESKRLVAVSHGALIPPLPHASTLKEQALSEYRLVKLMLLKLVMSFPDTTLIAVSNATAQHLRQLGIKNNIHICPPSTPHENPNCQPVVKNEIHNPVEICYVGRISPEKGLLNRLAPLAKEASNRNLPINFSIIGPSQGNEQLATSVQLESGDTIQLKGPKYGPDLCIAYTNADFLTLLSNTEGNPLVLQEAVRHATPIIGTDIPSIREFLTKSDSKAGTLVNPDNTEIMINQVLTFIKNLIEQPKQISTLSTAALNLSRQFDPIYLANCFINTILEN